MKKQVILFIVSAFLVSTFFFSCGKGKLQIFDKTVFDSIQVNETTHLFGDTAAPGSNLAISYVYPVKSENKILTDSVNAALISYCLGNGYEGLGAKAAIDSFQTNYSKEYLADVGPLYLEDKKLNPGEESKSWFDYYSTIAAHPMNVNSQILVYKIETSSYTGGAHGMYSTNYLNFDPGTGHIMRLKDIFKPGYEKELNELLVARLMKDTGSASLQELQDKAYLQDTDMYPSENFCMYNDSITFIYNVYEIAPYSSGITEITLPHNLMEAIMNK